MKLSELNKLTRDKMKNAFGEEQVQEVLEFYREQRRNIGRAIREWDPPKEPRKPKYQFTTQSGYVIIKADGRWIQEHRFIWEQINGQIPKGWVVHHINGKRDDNHPENLIAMSRDKHSTSCLMKLKTDRILELEDDVSRLQEAIEIYENALFN